MLFVKPTRHQFNRLLAIGAFALGVASILLQDADKSPLYFLLTYVLWRLP